MNRRAVLAQIAIFAVISVLVTWYALFDVIGLSLGNDRFGVTVDLPTAGGLFSGSEVTYRGVEIGTVSGVRLEPTRVVATLQINNSAHVPSNSIAHVSDLSAIGEQYLDFVSATGTPPYLHGGSVVGPQQTTVPPQTSTVLFDLEQWIDSIDPSDLGSLSAQLAAAFAGTGPELRQIIDTGSQLVDALYASRTSIANLLQNSATLLHSAAAHAGDFAQFSTSLQKFSQTLKTITPNISALLDESPGAASLFDDLIRSDGSATSVILGNLVSFSQIQVANIPGWKALLVAVPEFEQKAPTIVSDGVLHGLGLINYGEPVCSYGTALTSPISGTKTPLASVGCSNPASGSLERGAQNAPTTNPGQGIESLSVDQLGVSAQPTASGDTQVAGFNPQSGIVVNSDGAAARLGWNGGQSELLGSRSWEAVYLSGLGMQ
jgi:phospholipid/cholesterol/gamma-HCH transport system substrate-binding protein